ncbi:MAG: Osmosensitive channel histidine kinase KdpD, partial [Sphingomonas bacterium]|uniref:sensor histidine kinase n=1 Tax=Sphingomonas bacterium TaxID=1895847 RepID=UPI00262B06D0
DLTDAFAARLDQALRTPLGRIIANADSINAQSEGPLRQDYADYAADIASAGRHLMGLVDDLVDLQAIERPDFVVAHEPVDLADVARRAAGLLAVRASEAQVSIDKPGAQDVLPATGEFRRALQVLVNLIGNAVRYSPTEGMVWIRTERENGMAAIIVADQGKGIALDDQALRTPLGRIIANADSINAQSEGPLRQDYADYAADIASAGRHLMGLVDDLVDLQAIERPDFVVAHEPVDLADVARRAAGLLAVRASEAQVRIDKPGAQDVLPATGEFRRALQVLVNLIGNAVRYSPPEGMVWIRTERENGVAAIIVADQGKGIALEDQARIFEKFERVDPREAGGSGLGLYIARRLARAMGGDVTVDSAPGQGARFVFTLPYRE